MEYWKRRSTALDTSLWYMLGMATILLIQSIGEGAVYLPVAPLVAAIIVVCYVLYARRKGGSKR